MTAVVTYKKALSFPPEIALDDVITDPEQQDSARRLSGDLRQWMSGVHQALDTKGVWSPTFVNLAGGAITSTLGTYTKVGNIVFVTIQGTGVNIVFNGTTQVTNLPLYVSDAYDGLPLYIFSGYAGGVFFPAYAQNVTGSGTSLYLAPAGAVGPVAGIYLSGWYEVNQNG